MIVETLILDGDDRAYRCGEMDESGTSIRCSSKIVNAGVSCTSMSVVACAIVSMVRSRSLPGSSVRISDANHADTPTTAHISSDTATIVATNGRRWTLIRCRRRSGIVT